ncbi:MAG: DUF2066 domain-containing protein [bacterium]|nr:DUF2066 domain-containing protein [bacterium]
MHKMSARLFASLVVLLVGIPSFVCANPFIVQVPVDATAASPQAAREKALTQGRRQAFSIVVRRLVPPESRDLFSGISDKELEALTLGTAFEGEKHSRTRYLAIAHFRFDERALGHFLKEQGVFYANLKIPPQLLIPILTTSSGTQLWQEDNPWLNAWPLGDDLRKGAASVRLPLGDLQDRSLFPLLSVQERSLKTESVTAALSRYNVAGLFVAHLKSRDSGSKVTLYHLQVGKEWHKVGHSEFSEQPFETLLEKAKEETLSLANQWAQSARFMRKSLEKFNLLVPIQSISGWQGFQRMLQRLPSIERFQVHSLSTTEALVEIQPRGQEDFLQRTLAEEGWKLAPSSENDSTLKLYPLHFDLEKAAS